MNAASPTLGLFERVISYPDFDAQERLRRLTGLDEQKTRLSRVLGTLINPSGLLGWANKHHPDASFLIESVLRRPPLVILAGDVGSGKTALAESIGDAVARQEGVDIQLFPLSLASRGQGRVGEMTQLISSAFDYVIGQAEKVRSTSGRHRGGVVLLIDEADALAQSRENAQMHHEDRAGVNAFIRGIDRMASGKLPAVVIMCSNRLGSLDPAVKRRAAEIMEFSRPNDQQRRTVLEMALGPLGISTSNIEHFVLATGASGRGYGFTYSDITQRLLPAIVLDAYTGGPVDTRRALAIAKSTLPTPPFQEQTT